MRNGTHEHKSQIQDLLQRYGTWTQHTACTGRERESMLWISMVSMIRNKCRVLLSSKLFCITVSTCNVSFNFCSTLLFPKIEFQGANGTENYQYVCIQTCSLQVIAGSVVSSNTRDVTHITSNSEFKSNPGKCLLMNEITSIHRSIEMPTSQTLKA